MTKTVVIDCFQQGAGAPPGGYAAVVIDVIRATTTAVTAVAMGRKCFPVSSIEAAVKLARRFENPLLVGEQGGNMPYGFDLTNSPAAVAAHPDPSRPMILLSSSGTQLMELVRDCEAAYVACFRNHRFLADHLARVHEKVAIIGAGTRGEFREEDQMCAAWMAERLLEAGFTPENEKTAELISRWSGARQDAFLDSKSVAYLRASGQLHDLDFILAHFDDLNAVFAVRQGEITMATADDLAVAKAQGALDGAVSARLQEAVHPAPGAAQQPVREAA